MSKQLTKGKTIGLQLPLDLDKHVRERAASAGLSPGLWITKRLNAVLRVERHVGPPESRNGNDETDPIP